MKHGQQIRLNILNTGLHLWPNITARGIAKAVQMTHGAVLYHFKTVDGLKDAIARHAVTSCNSRVIAQLIASSHPACADMPDAIKKDYLNKSC